MQGIALNPSGQFLAVTDNNNHLLRKVSLNQALIDRAVRRISRGSPGFSDAYCLGQ